jgi:methylglutaconyl-CoA hydratase
MFRRIIVQARLNARSYSRQAFLEPLSTHPGVTCLSLNRPEAKNAISLTLLKVPTCGVSKTEQ